MNERGPRRVRQEARERVVAFVQARRLLAPGQRVLVGVGGGLRSLGLMAFLADAREELDLAHVAVGAVEVEAGDDSDAAEVVAEVGRLARALGMDFHAVRPHQPSGGRVDVAAELVELARAEGFDRVALANTRDDDAVRVLCELARGGGRVRGLAPRVRGGVVRPFLVLSDAEAMAFVPPEAAGQMPPGPPGSEEEKVRREVLPRLRALFPEVDLSLQDVGRRSRARRPGNPGRRGGRCG